MHVNGNHVKLTLIISILRRALVYEYNNLLFTGYDNAAQSDFSWDFMYQALQPNEKVKKDVPLYVVDLYSYSQNLRSIYMLFSHIQLCFITILLLYS